ncbi:multicopper oxidase family protein [Saliphagus infecundisoli]|uniref:Multicopper oxidase family protein n=1 Tax=Saliphagus infecundisoli TaxID=1849069 RepID=A0ABD5QI94_9EURY|nr:multicopper oxidase family protein [Saliphagus infecundisoli]
MGAGLAVATGLGGAGYVATRYLEANDDPRSDSQGPRSNPKPSYGSSDREYELTVTTGEIEAAPGETVETWLYDSQYPGPELRVREGERVRITIRNELPTETTVHWHGMKQLGSNAMDGVPGVTQPSIEPGEEFVYEFDAAPTGTHWYHSHVGLQLDRGLLGPLIVEENDPHVAYDREHTIVVDEYLTGEPKITSVDRGMMSGFPGGPAYDGTLVNGKLPSDPDILSVEAGERVRLRFLNAGSIKSHRVSVSGHTMQVTHADGPAVEPVEVDTFDLGMGERFDAVIEANRPGTWEIRARPLDDKTPSGRTLLHYDGSDADEPRRESVGTRRLEYGDLTAVGALDQYDGPPDQTIEVDLSTGGMMGGDEGEWQINGQVYPDADPIHIKEGDHVRLRVVNHSPMRHPMHLHGHHFVVKGALQDTVTVPGHMGQRMMDFVADNPGDWFFHCHNLYHLHTGMARLFKYE